METQTNNQSTALAAFRGDHNCAQSVLLAFSKPLRIPRSQCLRIASGFGGGIAMSAGTCGAVTGGIMVLGLIGTGMGDSKKNTYEKSKNLMTEFELKFGSCDCKKLTEPRENKDDKRFCDKFVSEATLMVEKLSKDN